MLLIPCPNCGERDESEFSYGGPATGFPDLQAVAVDWHEQLHQRDDADEIEEYWFHQAGCERWLRLRRDLCTHLFGELADSAGEGAY